jgi:peptide/nickel transport system ATP-binding protein
MDTADRVEPANVIEIDDLHISYETRKGDVEAIQGVSFTVREGETVGLVGESGCGKSTIAFGIVNFLGPNGKIVDGSIRFQDNELVGRSQEELKQLRGDRIAMVFQDPMQALNPSVRLGEQLAEVLTCHHADIDQAEAWQRSIDMLKRVNMPDVEDVMKRYSHQISGGQQQRVVIAMAMLNNPALLIMDEPTTALDVTVEAAVLDLIEELKQEFNAANIFITQPTIWAWLPGSVTICVSCTPGRWWKAGPWRIFFAIRVIHTPWGFWPAYPDWVKANWTHCCNPSGDACRRRRSAPKPSASLHPAATL